MLAAIMDKELKNTAQKYREKLNKVVCWNTWLERRRHNKGDEKQGT